MHWEVILIFPHQLFSDHPALGGGRSIVIVEESLYFRQFPFHKHKLILHRASMRAYADRLRNAGHAVLYVDTNDPRSDVRQLVGDLAGQGVTTLHMSDPTDDWLGRRMERACSAVDVRLVLHRSPNFLNERREAGDFFKGRKTYFQTDFYVWQRKQRHILLDAEGKPQGGQWTYDTDNRKRFPKGEGVPVLSLPADNVYTTEAREYVRLHFPDNPGNEEGPLLFAVTAEDAERWLDDFIDQRLEKFGIYEDAIVATESVLHHSLLTPMLNIGLLSPQQVIDKVLAVSTHKDIPLNSLEGFLRQVLGWREFIRIVYDREGRKQRTRNFWGFSRKIPPSFWTATTGIVPVDETIRKVLKTGYAHHIERLMVLGNFMLLCEFDPDDVYRWFMELFLDAYDWVMVPNVYGMSQYADGGLMTTKPYLSGSNYLMKMGDYAKGDWQQIWDGLFWRFLHRHRDTFRKNPRWSMLLKTLDTMASEKRDRHLTIAEDFLGQLDELTMP